MRLANTDTLARRSAGGTGAKMKSTAPSEYRLASAISSLERAVMKMMGVISDCQRWRMSAAASNPSMRGMQTSSRMTAKSWAMTQRSASRPESASTMW